MPRSTSATITAAAVLSLIGSLVLAATTPDAGTSTTPSSKARAPGPAGEGTEESLERLYRLESAEAARARGQLGRTGAVTRAPAPGWAGARVLHPRHNDWEPAVAADPNDPWVYVAVTRYGAPECGRCPDAAIMIERSADGGKTWSKARPLCRCAGHGWQADPILEVVPDTGAVYALWLMGWDTWFSRSDDHGRTWSDPVSTKGTVAWTDKPALTVNANGNRVYASWNGPKGGDLWIARSRDGGATWTRRKVVDSRRYYFAYNGATLPGGTVAFAQSSITYSGPGDTPRGAVKHHAVVSHDGGATWNNVVVDSVRIGVPCTTNFCSSDYYIGHSSIAATDGGTLVMTYDGAVEPHGFQRVWARTSTDGGSTWSGRVLLSNPAQQSGFPMTIGGTGNNVRMWFLQTRGGNLNAWNVYFRSSADGGRTWTRRARLSDVTSGYAYLSPRGFREPYGDYGEIAITSTGATFAVWGEGMSYLGPGGTWFNRQR